MATPDPVFVIVGDDIIMQKINANQFCAIWRSQVVLRNTHTVETAGTRLIDSTEIIIGHYRCALLCTEAGLQRIPESRWVNSM